MAEYINKNESVDESYLQNWYIDSVDEAGTPHWTEEHIEELVKDFIVIPIETPAADVEPVRRGVWAWEANYRDYDGDIYSVYSCSVCGVKNDETTNYCKNCGAKMEGEENGK